MSIAESKVSEPVGVLVGGRGAQTELDSIPQPNPCVLYTNSGFDLFVIMIIMIFYGSPGF